MLVFHSKGDSKPPSVYLLFGLGLIGGAVAFHLRARQFSLLIEQPVSWTDPDLRKAQLDRTLEQLAGKSGYQHAFVEIAWCAGAGNLGTPAPDLLNEKAAFSDVLTFFETLGRRRQVRFHFVSSAGGLFEGHRLVTPKTPVKPKRPYGLMKQAQEQALSERVAQYGSLSAVIYRPSTVYGSHEFHRRSGLVSHLVWNALRRVPTRIEGHGHSLRDYVWASDAAMFMARTTGGHPAAPGDTLTHHLVSAKPSSIFEVVRAVERSLGRSVGREFRSDGDNVADITFHPRLLPDGWNPAPLGVGIEAVLRETRRTFLAESTGV